MKRFFVAALSLALALPVFAQQKFNSDVENLGADCPVTLPAAFNTANARLPDPFTKLDGTKISSMDDWWCRRQEILRLAERTIYGTKPPKPASVTGTVSRTGISVSVSEGGKTASFSVTVSLPSTGSAPYPAVISYGNSGADAATIRGQGVAVINYTPTDVGAETGSRSKSGAFYTIYGTNSRTGTLAAWAWGVSRIIDVIEQSDGAVLKADAIGVTGCSRYGKGPFAAGAFDQRIALTIPVEGGTGGAAILRGAAKESGAQPPSSAFSEQPWLGDDFSAFQNSVNNLPVDMHEVVAMIAPRGLLILDKPGAADWLASRSGYASAMAGAEVYKALGFGGNITYHSNNTSGSHCAWITDWKTPVEDNIKRFLLRTSAPPAAPVINPRSDRTETMTNWIDWTTPALSGTLDIGGGGVTVSGFALSTASSPSIGGTVDRAPAQPAGGRYDEGQKVTLTAVPATGWKFDGWGGDASGTGLSTEITMDKNKSVTAKFTPTADGTNNLIKNGNFANTQNWTMNRWNSSDATFAVSGGAANITNITKPTGTNPADHNLQLVQNGISLTQGMKYRLTFDASAASARDISVYIQMDTSPYTEYLTKNVGLTNTVASFTYEFEMTQPSDDNARIAFNFGGAAPNVSISNVKLIYIAGGGTTFIGNKNSASMTAPSPSILRAMVLSSTSINVAFRALGSGETVLRLYNLKGSLISATKLQTVNGKNYSHTFNPGKLPNGFYIVGMYNNGNAEHARVVIPK